MSRNWDFELVGECAKIFLTPEIANNLFPADAEIAPSSFDFRLPDATIKQADSLRSILHVLRPNFEIPILENPASLLAERILADIKHFVIREQVESKIIHLRHVAANEQWRGEQAPKTDVCVLLIRL
jgi:hypothetical protein